MPNTTQQFDASQGKSSSFSRLSAIDCSDHVESKNGLSYLSWAWAVHYLLNEDPAATWSYQFWNDKPYCQIGDTAMVFCTVKAFGLERTAQLPVMNHRNQPIPDPNAFELNTAMQRCLAKAIALHGLGLYIYQGEDYPLEDDANAQPANQPAQPKVSEAKAKSAKNLPTSSSNASQGKSMGDAEIQTIRSLAEKAGVAELVIAKKYGAERIEDLDIKHTSAITSRLQEVIRDKANKETAKEPA